LLIVGWRCCVTLNNVHCGRRMTSHPRFGFLHTFIVDEAKQEGENDYAKCHPGTYDPGIVKLTPATVHVTPPRSTTIDVTVFINILVGTIVIVYVNCTSYSRWKRERERERECTNIYSIIHCASVTNMGFEFYTRPQQDIVLPQTTARYISILIG